MKKKPQKTDNGVCFGLDTGPQENEKMWGAGGLKAWSPKKGS